MHYTESTKDDRTIIKQQEVEVFLNQCGLSQYYEIFIEEGFDRPESLLELTENDLIQMQVKRGHRRLLQRAILNAKGLTPFNIQPIQESYLPPPKSLQLNEAVDISLQLLSGSPASSSTNDTKNSHKHTMTCNSIHPMTEYFPSAGTMTHSSQNGMSSTEEEAVTSDNIHRLWKRKYHRHAKPDTNAPLKPPSAYVMFSNDVRAELKEQNKSFTDLAKIIGDRWKNILPEEKEHYEKHAQKAREEYLKKIEEYQKTDAYKQYQKYISDFKAENEAAARPVGRPRKRHKRDGDSSDDSSRTKRASSISSQPEDQRSERHYPFYLLNEENHHKS